MTVRGPNSKLPNTPALPKAKELEKKPAARNEVQKDGKNQKGAANAFEHTATVELDAKLTPAAQGGKRVADAVMSCIASYDRKFLLDTDGLKAHVQQVATRFVGVAEAAQEKGSVYNQLKAKYPGAQISLAGTGSLEARDQVVYLVRTKDSVVHKFVEQSGKPVEDAKASDQIFMALDLGQPGKHMAVRVPDVKFLIQPTLPPSYGVGRQIAVVMDTPIDAQKRNAGDKVQNEMTGVYKEILPGDQKGEDGDPLGVILQSQREEKGVIVKYNGDKTYDVEVTQPDGSKKIVKQTEDKIRAQNDPTVYSLHGAHYDDVTINVDTDPALKSFLDQAKAVADKDIPKMGTPAQIAAGQKQALIDLTLLCNKTLSYPDEDKNTTDEGSKKFMALENSHSNWNPMKLGDLIDAGRGVCRHQAILMQLACQTAGISSRTVAASANDRQGNFRGYHAFLETTLDDGTQFLTDPTWFDAGPTNVKGYNFSPTPPNGQKEEGTPLWDTLYYQACRQVLPSWTGDAPANQDHKSIGFSENNTNVLSGGSTGGTTPTPPSGNGGATLNSAQLLQTVLKDLKSTTLKTSTDYLKAGADYLTAHSYRKAAKAFATAISNGTDTKAAWTQLATALQKAGLTKDATQAQQIAAGK